MGHFRNASTGSSHDVRKQVPIMRVKDAHGDYIKRYWTSGQRQVMKHRHKKKVRQFWQKVLAGDDE